MESLQPNMPLIIENKEQILIYYKYKYFKNGISGKDFRKERISDIEDNVDLDNAFKKMDNRKVKIQNMLRNM